MEGVCISEGLLREVPLYIYQRHNPKVGLNRQYLDYGAGIYNTDRNVCTVSV